LVFEIANENAVVKSIADAKLSTTFFLVNALKLTLRLPRIKTIGEIKKTW
jgi:hypothetical protein